MLRAKGFGFMNVGFNGSWEEGKGKLGVANWIKTSTESRGVLGGIDINPDCVPGLL